MDWNDITLRQFKELKKLNFEDLEDQIRAGEIILGINADDLTWVEYSKKVKGLDFLDQPIPKTIIRKTYTLNGRIYDCLPRIDEFSVGQYMDWMNLQNTEDLERLLAIVLIPKGKNYGDDIEQTYEDILDMSIVEVYGILNFFTLVLKTCIKGLSDFSIKKMKGLKRKDRKLIKELLELLSTECCSMLDQ